MPIDNDKTYAFTGKDVKRIADTVRYHESHGTLRVSSAPHKDGGGAGGIGGSACNCAFPVKVTSINSDGDYVVDVYADGKNEASTGTAILEMLQIALGCEVPVGTWLVAFPTTLKVTGGT